MKIEIKIPSVGESVQEALLAEWFRKDGDFVRKDEVLFVIETDKVNLEVAAEADGILKILVQAGETVTVGTVVGELETEAAEAAGKAEAGRPGEDVEAARAAGMELAEQAPKVAEAEERREVVPSAPRQEAGERVRRSAPGAEAAERAQAAGAEVGFASLAPSVRRLVEERGIDISQIHGTGPAGRVTKGDVLLYLEGGAVPRERKEEPEAAMRMRGLRPGVDRPREEAPEPPDRTVPGARPEPTPGRAPQVRAEERTTRKPMSHIRLRIAERLLEAKRTTAMLTTFNEIDMSRVQAIRAGFKEEFRNRYGVSLGLMSFFIKASVAALKEFPEVNGFIDGNDIVYHHYYHIGVAIGAERGLVVPVIRHADRLSFAEVEKAIVEFVKRIGMNRLELSDLEGGTFTITNGGVYGSLLSTPILNPPQSSILGMHKIEDRPIVVGGQVVVRPMMYVALSYDHRIVDGREAVTFLRRIKEHIENPERMMLEM